MREAQHEAIARWERRWLAASGVLLVIFVIFIAYSLTIEGQHIAERTERATPEQLTQQGVFAEPGVQRTGEGEFQVAIVAQAFSFTPSDVRLPAGAEATFYMTSRDVLHGYQVQDTNINVELVPGEVSVFRYTFDRPGDYRVTCNEYCGIGHQNMLATVTVLEPEAYEAALAEEARAEAQAEEEADAAAEDDPLQASIATGEAVYTSNCAGCHGGEGTGTPGVFPPLADHAPDLYAADGGRTYLIDVLVHGLAGPIEVGGASYDGAMPAWGQLSDAQLAGVLNYVLTAWGNEDALPDDFEPYAAEEVAPSRERDLAPADVHDAREALDLEP